MLTNKIILFRTEPTKPTITVWLLCLPVFAVFFIGCSSEKDQLFQLLPPDETGITFINEILEDEYFNIISYEYLYNGAGVGVGDFNNDGLQDIFFSGNMTSNRLYLNRGNLEFDDVTRIAGVEASGRWCTGVAVTDINGDGWQDLYVCASYNAEPAQRANMLFVNNGLNENGIPTFSEIASTVGIDDDGYSTGAAFFDYDNDGDLDLYVLTNVLDTDFPNKYRTKKNDGSSITNDRFYRNKGDGTFEEYTEQAGIRFEGYGLGISIVDINQDGWKDIYITNDYLTNDLLYINNQDGTFSNLISQYLKHTGHSAMGHDIADINNDGLPDIFTLDMLPDDNQRLKQMYAGSRFSNNADNERFGYQFQYKRNVLQLNNGPDAKGNHLFSEIGLYSRTFATDWSWSALLADFDNDGWRDLFISNGYPRDVTDLDYATSGSRRGMRMSMEEELEEIPVRHLPNYLFRNNGDYTFTDMSAAWGFDLPSFSNGAAYADLDNDGDLDLITSNINEHAGIYENLLYTPQTTGKDNHYLRLRLMQGGKLGIEQGALIYTYVNGEVIFTEFSTCHGFLSSVEPLVHVGLGKYTKADSLLIVTPYGFSLKMKDVQADQVLEIHLGRTEGSFKDNIITLNSTSGPTFRPFSESKMLRHLHIEDPFNDFSVQPAMPYQVSQAGPGLAVADVDGNGEFDLYVGGATNHPGYFFYQTDGQFIPKPLDDESGLRSEDQGILFFDAEGDGDQDLYVVSGSNELGNSAGAYIDRLYLNNGDGDFVRAVNALPEYGLPGTCVKGADIDGDGDIDLFIGGGTMPGRYPAASKSYILRNDSKGSDVRFEDITSDFCPDISFDKKINDALWTDFNNDSNIDLILAGEWMPITVLRNNGTFLEDVTADTDLAKYKGWWNSLAGGDFDNDGDIDYLAGNHGLNSYFKATPVHPITVYASDFDNNGLYDVILSGYLRNMEGNWKEYPLHFRNDINRQLESMKKKFPTFRSYSEASMDSVLSGEERQDAIILSVNYFQTSYIENLGNGQFKMQALPGKSQFAPVYGIYTGDFNKDQYLDALLVGNFYGIDPFWGRIDALNGLYLEGRGNGLFQVLDYPESGFIAEGDAKAIVGLPHRSGREIIMVSQNQDSSKCFIREKQDTPIKAGPGDLWAEITFEDGSIRKQEFYYGNSYLSQAARILYLPENTESYSIQTVQKRE